MRHRVRIRFRKEGDLRLLGHRDLVRTLERAFRRAEVPLSMSGGYHPRARLSFPLALAVGIEGKQEVMEVEFSRPVDAVHLVEVLGPQLPVGLALNDVQTLDGDAPKARVVRVTYEVSIPERFHHSLAESLQRLWQQSEIWVPRKGREQPVDLRANLLTARLENGRLLIEQSVSKQAEAGPREVLTYLGLAEIELEGCRIERTGVTLDGAQT